MAKQSHPAAPLTDAGARDSAKPTRSKRNAGQDSDRKILVAAKSLFLQFGYDGVNLDRIAELAGVSRQTLYNRFKGKEAIFLRVLGQHWQALDFAGIAFDALPQSGASAEAYLKSVAKRILLFVEEFNQPAFLRLIIAESRQMPWIAEEFYRLGKRPLLEGFANGLAQLEARGLINCPDRELAALQFLGFINEAFIWPRVMAIGAALNELPSTEKVIDEAVATFMARYGVREGSRNS